jgi:S1-C subfamily serine protease
LVPQRDGQVIQTIDGSAFDAFNSVGGPLQECVLPLIAKVGNRLWPVGTAFAVHPYGLLVTARHVIAEAASHAEVRTDANDKDYKHYELVALYMSSSRSDGGQLFGGALNVLEVWCPDEQQDVAIIRVEVPVNVETREPLKLRCAKIGTRPPKKGNPVAAVGYYKMSAEMVVEGQVDYGQQTAISTGFVTEVFHRRRDNVLATYPCFHVDGRFDNGMSGGPIFDDRNLVCGIVSRGLSSSDGWHGVGASIWSALIIPIQPDVGGKVEWTTLLQLARRGIVPLDESEAPVEINDGILRIRYKSKAEWKR